MLYPAENQFVQTDLASKRHFDVNFAARTTSVVGVSPLSQILSSNSTPLDLENGDPRMWCANCQADVAAEVTPDHRRVRCAVCSRDISNVQTSRVDSKTKEARELLERWSSNRFLDPYGPVVSGSTAQPTPAGEASESSRTISSPETETESESTNKKSKPTFRVDQPHSPGLSHRAAEQSNSANSPTIEPSPEKQQQATQPQQATRRQTQQNRDHAATPVIRFDSAQQIMSPHFDMQTAIDQRTESKSNWTSLVGQLLAYGGVAMLTVGTVLILWGYFGGPEGYTPTGWLISTAGQMLLFLGVVTLISGGMEQTTEEVSRRIDSLGEKILRFEQASREHALRGPLIPAERYAEADQQAQTQENVA